MNLTVNITNTSTKCRETIANRIDELKIPDLKAQFSITTKLFSHTLILTIPDSMTQSDILQLGMFIGVIEEQNRNT